MPSRSSIAAPSPVDAKLLKCAALGDREAFATVFLCYWPGLLEFTCKRYPSLDGHAAEDLASEAFMSLWEAKPRLASIRNLREYLKGIVHRLVADGFAHAIRNGSELSPTVMSSAPSPSGAMEQDELACRIAHALESLAKSHRSAMEMSQAGLSARQIAAIGNCTEKAARRRLQKAASKLRQALSRCGGACAVDAHRPDECPARKENLHCFKYMYRRVL